MRKVRRLVVALACAVLLSLALGASTAENTETRLSIVESRLTRVELDVSRLSTVPTSLARIEEQITALNDRAEGQASVVKAVGLAIIITVITGTITVARGRKAEREDTPS